MTPIYDEKLHGERRLQLLQRVALHQHMNIGDAVRIVKRDMSQQLAVAILEKGEPFFTERDDNVFGVSYLEYRADCYILTTDELRYLQSESFKKGIQHMQGFMNLEALR